MWELIVTNFMDVDDFFNKDLSCVKREFTDLTMGIKTWCDYFLGNYGNCSIEKEEGSIIYLYPIPGIKKEEIDIQAISCRKGYQLSIEMKEEATKKDKWGFAANLHQKVLLPPGAKIDEISSTLKDGVLKIKVPYEKDDSEGEPIKIPIKEEED